MADLTKITEVVQRTKGRVDSIIALVTGLSEYIRNHADDPTALNALADELDAKGTEIVTAVEANPIPPVV